MKSLKLKKLIAVVVTALTIATVSPIGASAEWKQDSNGWWNTEGSSWSTGWRSINGSWYCFGSDGYMKTGWINDGGTWYYTAPSGEMKTGWVNDGGTWYFTAASGAMETGAVEVDGKVYYLAPSGAMATGSVTIGGVTYSFAPSGEAIGDKIPTPTVAFTSAGTAATPSKPATPTTSTGGSSSGGGGGSHNGGSDANDITPLVSRIFSEKIADVLKNHPTLDKKIIVNTSGNPIVVTLRDQNLDSLQEVFTTAQHEELSLLKARLTKAEEIMNASSEILNVGGGSFKKYLANGVDSTYFKNDGSFKTDTIAENISNGTLTYDKFKEALKDRIIVKCNGTNPEVSVSYAGISKSVTAIQKSGTGTIYDTNSTVEKNIDGLVSLGDTTTGTYTIYCGNLYFTVKVTK